MYEEEFLATTINTGGTFFLPLGTGLPISGTFSSINFNSPVFITLNTRINLTPTYDGEMNPRIPLRSVPYALNSQKLDGRIVGGANGVVAYDASSTINTNGLNASGTINALGNVNIAGTTTASSIFSTLINSITGIFSNLFLTSVATGTASDSVLVRDTVTGEVKQDTFANLLSSAITNTISFATSTNVLTSNVGGVISTTAIPAGASCIPGGSSPLTNECQGTSALQANTTGVRNSAFGDLTLASNTVGVSNTALGYSALAANVSGSNNGAFGGFSLFKNVSGNGNLANGISSLFNNVSGSRNTGVGNFSLTKLVTGVENIAIGFNAGFSQLGGDSNIIIGSNLDVPDLNGSNQLNIGDIIYGVGVSTSGGGNIGIGTTTPNAQFTTTGSVQFAGIGNSATNTNILTVDAAGNVETRSIVSLLAASASTTNIVSFATSTNIFTSNVNGVVSTTSLAGLVKNTKWYSENLAAPIIAPVATGLASIAVGDGAAATGRNIYAFGDEAGRGSNSSYSNFFGWRAGKNSGNGGTSENNFFGIAAGEGATNVAGGNFFGSRSGGDAINASFSNFFGESAGELAIRASFSNFFGRAAGSGAINANNSNFFGLEAGRNASNAYGSNFYGVGAGYEAINANNSNFLGTGAGNFATNAANSIFIGTNAGTSDLVDNTTGGTSILIGRNTNTGGFSNSIAIGESAINDRVNQFLVGPNYSDFSFRGVNYVFPASQGATGTTLVNDGSGVLSWAAAGASTSTNAWSLLGNAGTNPAVNFIGTTDAQDFIIRTDNVQTGKISADGTVISFGINAGVGTTNALSSSFIGVNSGSGAINAFFSNFFGQNAGANVINANRSNFIGINAGNGASAAQYSNLFGFNAGVDATNAIHSNFIGTGSGQDAINSQRSNFIGFDAGAGAPAASNSNFFGSSAGFNAFNASSSNFIGNSAGFAASNANASNFFGPAAGFGATGADNSNFIGAQSGQDAINSRFSNFVGYAAGSGALNADNSNFFGQNAGSNTNGAASSNFFGSSAGFGATGAANSNFFGTNAGNSSANAGNSNFFGLSAGFFAINANNSNFFGANAGLAAADAANSNFFGLEAGSYASNAYGSNFYGVSAGYGAVNANNSNFFGTGAGNIATNAANSIFIGTNAGASDIVDNTAGGTSILIGSGSNTGGFSNSIALGANAVNTKTNQFLVGPDYSDFSFRGINYTFPSVQGNAGDTLTNDGTGVLSWSTLTGGGRPITASNGLTLLGVDVKLGGALSQDTSITQGAFDLSFARNGYELQNSNAAPYLGIGGAITANNFVGARYTDATSDVQNGVIQFGGPRLASLRSYNNSFGYETDSSIYASQSGLNLLFNDSNSVNTSANVDVNGLIVSTSDVTSSNTGFLGLTNSGTANFTVSGPSISSGLSLNNVSGSVRLSQQIFGTTQSMNIVSGGIEFDTQSTNRFRIENNGDLKAFAYGSGRNDTSVSTPFNFLYTDSTGVLSSAPISLLGGNASSSIIASNGLNASGTNIKLGGVLTQNTNINFATNTLTFDQSNLNSRFKIKGASGYSTPSNRTQSLFEAEHYANAGFSIESFESGPLLANKHGTKLNFTNNLSNPSLDPLGSYIRGDNLTGDFEFGTNAGESVTLGSGGVSVNSNSFIYLFGSDIQLYSPIVNFSQFGSTRDDSASTTPSNFLYTDINGSLKSAPVSLLGGNSTSSWSLLGNAGTNPATTFLGTTDAQDLSIRTNNTEVARFGQNNNFAFGVGAQAVNSDSIAMGAGAGAGATNAPFSNFFGSGAGFGAINAANSIFIGTNAGANDAVNNTLGADTSILIGNNTNTGGFSNSIALGEGAVNTSANQLYIRNAITNFNLAGVNYSFPTVQGALNTTLSNDGNGNLTWVAPGAGSITASNGLNAVGVDVRLGGALNTPTTINATGTNDLTISGTSYSNSTGLFSVNRFAGTSNAGAAIQANSTAGAGLNMLQNVGGRFDAVSFANGAGTNYGTLNTASLGQSDTFATNVGSRSVASMSIGGGSVGQLRGAENVSSITNGSAGRAFGSLNEVNLQNGTSVNEAYGVFTALSKPSGATVGRYSGFIMEDNNTGVANRAGLALVSLSSVNYTGEWGIYNALNRNNAINGSLMVGSTTAPTERLDVAGNLRLRGAFMPGNQAGGVGSLLISQGPNVAPIWSSTSTLGLLSSANNGLTVNPAGNAQLGGGLLQDTTIINNNFALDIGTGINGLKVAANGQVGIGNNIGAIPGATLLVKDTVAGFASLNVVGGTSGGGAITRFINDTGATYLTGLSGSNNSALGLGNYIIRDQNAGLNRLVVASNGNVGIGDFTNVNPVEKLSVAGNINISSGSAYMLNGVNVLRSQTALNNIYAGPAGNLTGTGQYNTAIGYDSFNVNTTGQQNTATGFHSMNGNTTGSFNTANGLNSLYFNSTGSNNNAFGYNALFRTTSSGNNAFGNAALQENVSGIDNVAMGNSTLSFSLGNTNSAFGSAAGALLVNGNNNTFSGYKAGFAQTAGSNNLVLGANTDLANLTGSNQLNIANIIFGTGLTGSVSAPLGNIGLGTTTPAERLQVLGDIRIGTSGVNGCLQNFAGTAIAGVCSSDENLKINIQDLATSTMDKFSKLRFVSYNWNNTAGELYKKDTTATNTGILAQQVEGIFPELVTTDNKGYKVVDISTLFMYSMQVTRDLINRLDAEVINLKNIVASSLTAERIYVKRVEAEEVITQKLCVKSACVTETEFLEIINNRNNTSANNNINTNTNTNTNTTTDTMSTSTQDVPAATSTEIVIP